MIRGGLGDLPKTFKGGSLSPPRCQSRLGCKARSVASRWRERAVPWLCLFASALAALGTADASPAQHHKPLWQHRSKAAEAEGHKHGTATGREAEQSSAAEHTGGACGRAECPSAD